ncbi:type II secretion system protein GspM [Marinicella rhabdoformis]|uniref:type II secretion system protein GspM n=1 Tax=Marinicella rhabdoformis TaxID=2580566 RepID=UPI0012AEDBA6|nr:type II secretion system protein GspM [Marinicella rhabdoformis]
MNKWFLNLSDREQQLAKSGIVFLILALFLAFVYLPVNRSLASKHMRLQSLNQQLVQMEQSLATKQGVQTQGSVPNDVTFSAWLDQQMVRLSLQTLVTRAEPVDENTMTLWLQNAPFDKVVDWLTNIESAFGVSVIQVDVVAKDKANGLCDIRMTLVK